MLSMLSCKKFLDVRSDESMFTPAALEDLQSILDDNSVMNLQTPSMTEVSADDYFITDEMFASIPNEQDVYTWNRIVYNYENDWSRTYNVIYNANLCLERSAAIRKDNYNTDKLNNVVGSALFFRGYSFLNLCWTFAKAYDPEQSKADLGIAIREQTDLNIPSIRSSAFEGYQAAVEDLRQSAAYLPDQPALPTRPSKTAAYGMLARAFLSMREYDSAYKYVSLCLELHNDILDYNSGEINSGNIPFASYPYNQEVIFYSVMSNSFSFKAPNRALIDTILYKEYSDADKRKEIFFRPNNGYQRFKGSYAAHTTSLFTGLATDEMLLIKSECEARNGKANEAMNSLNTLLINRYETGSFSPVTAADAEDAVNKILLERRKELLMRGIRWSDIKRLNKEGRDIHLYREVAGNSYNLPPNDDRYALQLPDDIIKITGMPQN